MGLFSKSGPKGMATVIECTVEDGLLVKKSDVEDFYTGSQLILHESQQALFAPIPGYGEDVSFCLRARKAGFRLWCDSRIKIGHIASTTVTEETFQAYRKKREELKNA